MGVSRSVGTVAFWASLSMGVACSDKGAEMAQHRLRVAVGSERDATAEVRIEALGVALRLPGEGWKLAHADAAQSLAQGAVIAAVGPNMVAAALIVTPVATSDVGTYALRKLARSMGEAPKLEPLAVHETTGRRYAQSDGSLRRAGAIWLKAGMAFELRVWGVGDDVDRAVDQLLGAMSFFERRGKVAAVALEDQKGADWRLRAGVYENPASGLRVDITEGLRLVVGAALSWRDPQADFIIEGTRVPMSLTVASEPVTSARARASRRAALSAQLVGEDLPGLPVEILGSRVVLTQRQQGSEVVVFGDVCVAQRTCHAIVARYAAETGRPALVAALASVSGLGDARREALLKELDGAPAHHCSVGDGYSLRGRVYRSFMHDFTLTAPGPAWTMSAGGEAKQRVPASSVFMEARRWGLEATVVVDEGVGTDADVYHAAVLAALSERGGLRANGTAKKVGASFVSEGSAAAGLSLVVATQIVGDRGMQFVVWGAPGSVGAHGAQIQALLSGLSSGVEKAIEQPLGAYLDRRIGVSAAMPVGWRMQPRTPSELQEHGTFVTWQMDGRWVGLLAMCLPDGARPAWSARFLEQRLRQRLGPYARGELSAMRQPVSGRDASGTSWHAPLEYVDSVVFRRGNVVYAIAAVDHKREALDKAIEHFVFID